MPHPHEGFPIGDITRSKEDVLAIIEHNKRESEERDARRRFQSDDIVYVTSTSDYMTKEYSNLIPMPDLGTIERTRRDLHIAQRYMAQQFEIEERKIDFIPAINASDNSFGRDFWIASAAKDMGIAVTMVTPAIDYLGEMTDMVKYSVAIGAPLGSEAEIRKIFPYDMYSGRSRNNPYSWYAFGIPPSNEKYIRSTVGTIRTLENMPDDLHPDQHLGLKISGQMTTIALDYDHTAEVNGGVDPENVPNSMRSDIQWFNDRIQEGYRPHSVEALQGLAVRAVYWALRQDT